MAINLFSKYGQKLLDPYYQASFLAGKTGAEYEFTGVKELRLIDPILPDIVDYNRTASGNRYGIPKEIQDVMYTLMMTQDKSFTGVIDRGNNLEQMNLKSAGKIVSRTMQEKVTPLMENYAVNKFVQGAGTVFGADAIGTITAAKALEAIATAEIALSNKYVARTGRYLFIRYTFYGVLRAAEAIIGNESLGKKTIESGVVGSLYGFDVIPLPDSAFPEGVYALAFQKRSTLMPIKLIDTKVHQDPPGISGHQLEGRFMFDAFIVPQLRDAVYVIADKSVVTATPTITVADGKATIASSGATNIWYTVDGSDPKDSSTKEKYTAAVTVEDKYDVRAYAETTGKVTSGVAKATNKQ